MSSSANRTCLALETAVGSGSVAVIRGARVVAESERGDLRPSRAEHVLGVITEVLDDAGMGLPDIAFLAVSTGPGSYSGIRIGLSTAIGLKNALGIECRGVSILHAIATRAVISASREFIAAVPVGKNDAAWQRFHGSGGMAIELDTPTLGSIAELKDAVTQFDVSAPLELLKRIGDPHRNGSAADDATSLAALVGMLALEASPDADLKPIYLRSGAGF